MSPKYINLVLFEKDDITRQEADQFARATLHGNIDDIKQSKRAMAIYQIARLPDGSHPKFILVEGAPGVGKSTFAWHLCRMWGEGVLLQQYKLVVLLRLRDKSVRAAKSIPDLFRYCDHQVQQVTIEEIQGTNGKGVLLMFEGYDELPEEMRRENSIFLDVITGRVLPEVTVLVTSRPWASEFLHLKCKMRISQHIQIVGFTKKDIWSYLENATTDDPSLLYGLDRYISCYPHINSMMYIPLNTALVVEVYRNSTKNKTLVPKTMTELYSFLVRNLLQRHLLDHPVHGQNMRWQVPSFSDLPPDVYQQLRELARIAYEGILHGQQVIFFDLPEGIDTLGLVQFVPELYGREGAAVSYNFLHLTVQEYLAAFHLSQQPIEKQVELYRKYCTGEDKQMNSHLQMVLQFLSGLNKFNGYLNEMVNTLGEITFDTLCWLFEAQDNEVSAKLLGSSNIKLSVRSCVVRPFDCFVLGYCLSHSNCAWRIDLFRSHIGDEGVEMLVQGAVEEENNFTGGISEVDLEANDITPQGMKCLSKFPIKLINKLGVLNLSVNQLNSESCATLAHLVPHMPHLKTLRLSDNPNIGPGGVVPLIRSLTAYNSLEQLDLKRTAIGVEDCQAVSELLLSTSTNLTVLSVGSHGLPPEAVELIISGLHRNTALEGLYMFYSHFSLKNTTSLASVLETNHTLVVLSLRYCNIDPDGACQLASALCTNDTVQELILLNNPIGVKGAAAFAQMLLKNKSLKEVDLRDDSIGEEGTQNLMDSLANNSTLDELWLPRKYSTSITTIRKQTINRTMLDRIRIGFK